MAQWFRHSLLAAAVLLGGWSLAFADFRPTAPPDLSGFRTVDTAVTAGVSRAVVAEPARPAYLGIQVDADGGRLVIAQVEADSPAARAGLRAGDVVRAFAGQAPASVGALRDLLQSRAPGQAVAITVLRDGRPVELRATLDAPGHPPSAAPPRPLLGVQVSDAPGGARVDGIVASSPAEGAGLRKDDLIVRADGKEVPGLERFRLALDDKKPGDLLALIIRRDGRDHEFHVRLGADHTAATAPARGDDRTITPWTRPVYRLAVVPVEFPDVKHNEKITARDWEEALFSRGKYTDKSATGQPVYGSLNDYYLEQSSGRFHVEGRVFPCVEVGRKRADYAANPNRYALLTEAVDRLLERDGPEALRGFDGLFFLYAGERPQALRGSLFWPHRSTLNYNGQRMPYFICPEGGPRMTNISVMCHEFGHLLGLPDLYARAESPGSEGVGVWCTMSTGFGREGKPLHLCAWCKEQLGWLRPAVIDPTVRQKLILSPVEGSAKECFKIPVRPDGSEYLLLENRATKGFDRDLPGTGLVIWRVTDGRPVLEGPGREPTAVPYPRRASTAFTPKGGGLPVHLTNIRRLPDGRVTFWVGYEYL